MTTIPGQGIAQAGAGTDEPVRLELPSCDDSRLFDMSIRAAQVPTLIAADELRLFSLLAESPATPAEVAERLSLGPRATEAVLAILASLGFLLRRGGRFYLTDVSRNYLLPEGPFYWGGMLRFLQAAPMTAGDVLEAIKRDQPTAYEGQDIWETHEMHPDLARVFTGAMHAHSFPAAMGAARRADFSGVRRLLDVGGGSGGFCIALALRHPEMRFTVLELPVVSGVAREYIARFGLEARIEVATANMFKGPWPAGHDAVLFSEVFHDWDLGSCRALVKRSFEALPPGGRIYLHEMLLSDTKDGPATVAAYSMGMLVFGRGKQYTAAELGDLLSEGGFVDVSVLNTYGYFSLVSGQKP